MQVGRLRTCGYAKESQVGQLVAAPTTFVRFEPPDGFFPKITPLVSKAVGSLSDLAIKSNQGPADLKGMKLKLELEGENAGDILNACFGLDTPSETASLVVTAGVNDKIDFKESGGAQLTATVAPGTYIMGSTDATLLSLLKAVKTAMNAAAGAIHTYTLSYSTTTKKVTITPNAGTLKILWLTGTNNATGAYPLLGFTKVDTADAGTVTSDSTIGAVWAHLFTRQQVTQLPTYTWWFDKAPLYPQFAGCMLNALDIDIKAKELVTMETEWDGLTYDTTGITRAPTYSAVRPFVFNQAVVTVDGAGVLNYDNIKVSIKNMVQADHVVGNTIYPAKIYAQGFDVEVSMDLFFEDAVQYNKFLAGTAMHLAVVLTSGDQITGAFAGARYSLAMDIPILKYRSANLPVPSGVLKIPFTGYAEYDPVTSKSISMTLTNSQNAAY